MLEVVDRVLASGRGLYERSEVRSWARLDPDWPPPGRGLPIGSYTSQLFATHVYLADCDHFVKRELKVPGYVRYVDDLLLFACSRSALRRWRAELGAWLITKRGLKLKHPEARVLSCRGHLDALGYRLRRDGLIALPRPYRRLARRVRSELLVPAGSAPRPRFERSVAASAGVLLF